jgi:hypothetical protein
MSKQDKFIQGLQNSLTGYDQVKPSAGLWKRISRSMFWKSIFVINRLSLPILIGVSTLITVCVVWAFNSNQPIQMDEVSENNVAYYPTVNKTNDQTKVIESTNQASISTKSESLENSTKVLEKANNSTSHKSSTTAIKEVNHKNLNTIAKSKETIKNKALASEEKNNRTDAKTNVDAETSNTHILVKKGLSNPRLKINQVQSTYSTNETKGQSVEKADHTIANHIANQNSASPYIKGTTLNPFNSIETKNTFYLSKTEPYLYTRKRLPLWIDLYYGQGLSNRYLTSEFANYASYRNDNEQLTQTFQFGAQVSYRNKNFHSSIGLQYFYLAEQSKYILDEARIDNQWSVFYKYFYSYNPIITGWNTTPSGDSIPVYQNVETVSTITDSILFSDTIIESNFLKSTLEYSYIEIPILVGYSIPLKHFNIELGSGISMGLLQRSSGQIISSKLDDLYDLGGTEMPIRKVIFNGLVQLGLSYPLNERSYIILRNDLKFNLNSIFDSGTNINQKYLFYHLNLGFRYKI